MDKHLVLSSRTSQGQEKCLIVRAIIEGPIHRKTSAAGLDPRFHRLVSQNPMGSSFFVFNGTEKHYFHEIFRFISIMNDSNNKESLNNIISDKALDFLDKSLTKTIDADILFYVISLLRLLLLNNTIKQRYSDLKLINNIAFFLNETKTFPPTPQKFTTFKL